MEGRSQSGEVRPTVFVRRASGLVRGLGLLEAFVPNHG